MDRALEKYMRFEFKGDEAYVRKDRVKLLRDVDAAIFDCDGVLIDIRDSYDRAISETVAYILERFTGYPFPRGMITGEIIFLFRKSGGFNNDWDTCYGILMYMLCNLPENFQEIFKAFANDKDIEKKALERLLLVENAVRQKGAQGRLNKKVVDKLVDELTVFADKLDESGVLSVDRTLLNTPHGSMRDCYKDLRRLLYHPNEVGRGIIPTVFEEIFCGSDLLKQVYGVEPIFRRGRGLIDNERLIVRLETLSRLSSILGGANLGIASGSRFKPAKYILGNILDYFNSNAIVFLDDIEREEAKILKNTGKTVNLKKPNAFSLLTAAKGLMPFNAVLCVGDSMEDALMAEGARKEDPRFMFAGVYQYSGFKQALLQSFLRVGADIIVPSVNEMPLILEAIDGETGN